MTVAHGARGTASVTLIRGADLVAAPWKNGGGMTREVAAFPSRSSGQREAPGDFVWRVSVAEVAPAGPFSRFEGVDRTLVLLSGAGMLLDELDDAEVVKSHALKQPLDVARFDGEARIEARLIDGATRDFNLMVRRDLALGVLDVWRCEAKRAVSRMIEGDVVLLYCASGSVALGLASGVEAEAGREATQLQLETGDTLRIDIPRALTCTLEGTGAVLAISIRYTRR
ncbi:HutD family protein [Paraburkholderia sp. Ac-20336]|uniref:HutD/Ves family protein n=1 Tax=Paraburkholderia sp. Ac-20336 TaxID=2703886 RepID=UPI00198078B7|nr:HutD family protein [Paraburkholderia sp. Ac-20336]MBN3805340.1 HutD family protein [Paraburkholderia sp. Ac-20336]